jgi:tetratricopeptide (TPR) repeat protein
VEVLRNIASTALVAGFPEAATELAKHALQAARDIDWRWSAIGSLVVLGDAALALDELDVAEQYFTQARDEAGVAGNYWDNAIVRGTVELLRMTGRPAEAADLAGTRIDAVLPRERAKMLTELAAALLALDDRQSAIERAGQAERVAGQYGHRLHQISALYVLADAHEAAGDRNAAQEARYRAAELSEPVPAEIGPTLRRLVTELDKSEED